MKKLFSVSVFTALLTLLRMCTGFLIAKVIAIYTGPTGMAMLGQLQSVVGVLNGIGNAPVGAGVVRYTAENIDKGIEYCAPWWKASVHWLIFILSILIPIGCLASQSISIFIFDNKDYYWLIILACLVLPFSVVNTLIISVINGQQKYKIYVVVGMLSTIIATIITILFVYYANIKGALIASAINSAICGVVLLVLSRNEYWFQYIYWFGKTDSIHIKKIGQYVLMTIVSAITVPVSLIMIRNILITNAGWDLTGQWQAVWRISEVYLSIIVISLSIYYIPLIATTNSKKSINTVILKTAKLLIPLSIILGCSIYILRDVIISILFTNDFVGARDLFFIQIVGDIIKVCCYLFTYIMVSKGVSNWFIFTEVFFSLLFVLLVYFLVPIYNVQGANFAYLINYSVFLVFLLCWYFFVFNKRESKDD